VPQAASKPIMTAVIIARFTVHPCGYGSTFPGSQIHLHRDAGGLYVCGELAQTTQALLLASHTKLWLPRFLRVADHAELP
jgi:hypothetical protein